MIWTAWRLQRSVYLVFVGVSLILIGYAIFNGLHIEAVFHQWLGAPCHGGNGFAVKYRTYCLDQFQRYSAALGGGAIIHWFAALPMTLLGLLLGASLVAGEIDHRSTRIAWTQSTTRSRWFASKVAVGLGSLMALAIPLCITVSWWLSASRWSSRISTNGFPYTGWIPLTAGIFAFAATTLVGVIVRRPGATIAIGLVVMTLVPWAMQTHVRTDLVPLHSTELTITIIKKGSVTVGKPMHEAPPNAWVVYNGYVPVGRATTVPTWVDERRWLNAINRCPIGPGDSVSVKCIKRLGIEDVQIYVADSQYGDLQLREGGLYLSGAVLLLGAGLLLVRRSQT